MSGVRDVRPFFTPSGLDLPPDLTFEEWKEVGTYIMNLKRTANVSPRGTKKGLGVEVRIVGRWLMRPLVYRIYDGSGNLLYVGSTTSLKRRLIAHKGTQAWWGDAATVEGEVYPTIEAARLEETQQIAELKPQHNDTFVSKPRKNGRKP